MKTSPDFLMFDRLVEVLDSGLLVSRFRPFDLFDSQDFLAMADWIGFNAGRCAVEDTGWPGTVYFDLSTNAVSDFTAATAYASRAAIGGTGYAQSAQTEPSATGLGSKVFPVISWATGAATNWTAPKTIVASDGSSYLLCAWNLIAGGVARDMSQANSTLNCTPTYAPTNPP